MYVCCLSLVWVHATSRFVYVVHATALCVLDMCVSVCVPVSIMVPGGRPASISRQQALVHCLSIDGPPVLDSRPLPTVTGQDGYMYGCVCVYVCTCNRHRKVLLIHIHTEVESEMSVCVWETAMFVCDPWPQAMCHSLVRVYVCVR